MVIPAQILQITIIVHMDYKLPQNVLAICGQYEQCSYDGICNIWELGCVQVRQCSSKRSAACNNNAALTKNTKYYV